MTAETEDDAQRLLIAITTDDFVTACAVIARSDNERLNTMNPRPLILASLNNRIEVMRLLLDRGAMIDVVNDDLQSACIVAVNSDHLSALNLLIERGADLDLIDRKGQSALLCALRRPKDELSIALLRAGASIEHLSVEARIVAATKSVALLAQFMKHTDQISTLRTDFGRTPCHFVVAAPNTADADKAQILRMLVNQAGVDINIVDISKRAAIHIAALLSNDLVLRALVELGADTDHGSSQGPPLHIAAMMSHPPSPCVVSLLAIGADVRSLNSKGASAAHKAAQLRRSDALCALLAAGADLEQRDSDGRTIRDLTLIHECPWPTDADLDGARRRIARTRLDLVRQRAVEVCIALQSLDLDALRTCEILRHCCGPFAHCVAFHQWWTLTTTVKHFVKKAQTQEQEIQIRS